MANKLPIFPIKHKICIICEGYEDYYYLERLKGLNVWNAQYDFHLENARGNGCIPARYQDLYQNDTYELVLVFCDTEKKPHEQYEDIKRKINEFLGIDGAAEKIIIFSNPCTLQIIAKHWADVTIKSPAKPVNAPLVKQFTGVDNYKARADQIIKVMECVNAENYIDMHQRIKLLSDDDSAIGSSNFGKFIDHFESNNHDWINEINKEIDYDLDDFETGLLSPL